MENVKQIITISYNNLGQQCKTFLENLIVTQMAK
jgi:hypothetical protein